MTNSTAQAYTGLFHLLPLGLRVQEKIERLIEHFMDRVGMCFLDLYSKPGAICSEYTDVGASKVALSSISSEALWQKSGRLKDGDSEVRLS